VQHTKRTRWRVLGTPTPYRKASDMNVLMVCSLFSLPYRVMQCIAATGAVVHVLGSIGSRGLRYSRYCRRFLRYEGRIAGDRDPAFAGEINRCVRDFGIDMVVPAGPAPTRALIASRDMIDAPCFPLPSLKQFDFLNDKWQFTNSCIAHGIACPPSMLFADRAQVAENFKRGLLTLPAIVKPLSENGGHGVLRLDASNAASQIERINYGPIIVQNFIEGEDIGASVFCERGEIKSFIANRFSKGIYTTFQDPVVFAAFSRILGPMEVDGVYHFDMRLTPDKKIYFLECNPRFYFKISLSMIAGINFIHAGLEKGADLPSSVEAGTQVKRPWALAASLGQPWTITRRDIALLWSLLSDPIPFIRETLRIDWDS
jgi:predicted ATP-grasp superfamily ATP-dependent carboligase